MNHLTAATITRLMQANRKTIAGLAAQMGVTKSRVRQVRAQGVKGRVFVMDWMEALTGNPQSSWEVVAKVYQ